MNTSRQLATVEQIISIHPIENADAIVRARVRGWDVVVKRDELTPGDLCVYIEVDSHLDVTDDRFAFLAPRGVRTSEDGFTGHVLKTAKLRGQYSQGIVFPLSSFPELAGYQQGADVTDILGVRKYEQPVPEELRGQVRGFMPDWIPTTDEDRIQNAAFLLNHPGNWVATEKIDGTSMTVYVDGSDEGVCGRNYNWSETDTSPFWALARQHNLFEMLRRLFPGQRAAVQGELFGPGIPPNPLNVPEKRFLAFTVIVDGLELPRSAWPQEILNIAVPVHDLTFPTTVDDALAQVETLQSLVAPGRGAEGVVWRNVDTANIVTADYVVRASFKALSRKYLLKHDRG